MNRNTINKLKSVAEVATVLSVDVASLLVIFQLSIYIREALLPRVYSGFPEQLLPDYAKSLAWMLPVWIAIFFHEGTYTKRFLFWDEIKSAWKASFFATVGVFSIVFIGKLSGEISRTVVVLMGALAMPILPLTRMAAKKLLKRVGLLGRRVLILGAGETGKLIAGALKKEPNYGYEVIGYLDDDPAKIGGFIDGVKIHKGINQAAKYIKACNITDIIIAMPGLDSENLRGLVTRLQHEVNRILFVPDAFGLPVSANMQHFFREQAVVLEVKNNLAQTSTYLLKRTIDFAVSVILLFLFLFPMLVMAALIRATSKGPAILKQERIGKNWKPFICYKFRTMYMDAEARLTDILQKDPAAREEWENHWKIKNDPRVTAFGRFLRQTSLDELPQLLNIVKGQMSLVGPRPYLPREKEFLTGYGSTILGLPPGITGLWQVSGRSETSYEYRLAMDSWYVRNWTLWLDVVILLRTVAVVLRKQGAM